jgi:hypothetical protein
MGGGQATPGGGPENHESSPDDPKSLLPQGLKPMAGKNHPDSILKRYFSIWCGPVLIAMVFLALTALTWRKWPDLLIDFGRELYVPWQLLAGKVLYRDIAYLNGPLSPYLNALWFKIFGGSLTTIIFCNLVIIVFITTIIFLLIRKSCNAFTATFASIVFLSTFVFGHIVFVGNYNYVCPYSHELTHGIFLALLLIIFLSLNINRCRPGYIILAGLCLGLIFLGKAEVFLAAAGAATVGLSLVSTTNNLPGRKIFFLVGIFLLAMVTPIAGFFIYLMDRMPWTKALGGIAGTWTGLWGSNVSKLWFYQLCTGFDHPWHHLGLMILQFLGIGLVMAPFFLAGLYPQHSRPRKVLWGLAAMFFLGVICLVKFSTPFFLFNRSLPLSVLAATALIIALSIRNWDDQDESARLAPLAMLAVLGLGLLAKIILNARIWQYGFVLAMPAAILLVAVLVGLIPELVQRLGGQGKWFRLAAGLIIMIDVICSLQYSYSRYAKQDLVIGDHGDAIITYGPQVSPRGSAVLQLLHYIHSAMPPDANFVVLPEGVMINYLTRHVNPTPFINFMPPELIIFGETPILQAFKNHPPDYIILIHKNTKEYGLGFFGTTLDNGKNIMEWVNDNYMPILHILASPLEDNHFGIKVLKWRGLK